MQSIYPYVILTSLTHSKCEINVKILWPGKTINIDSKSQIYYFTGFTYKRFPSEFWNSFPCFHHFQFLYFKFYEATFRTNQINKYEAKNPIKT